VGTPRTIGSGAEAKLCGKAIKGVRVSNKIDKKDSFS
jgi:hypothetical protein